MEKICNAKITSTMLGFEDHGFLTFYLMLDWPGRGCGFGGYVLASHDGSTLGDFATKAISRVLEVVGVERWEDLQGKLVRIMDAGLGAYPGVSKIGNILEDKWLDLKELSDEAKVTEERN